MKNTVVILLAVLLHGLLISTPVSAAEHAGEIWVDGPEDKQPTLASARPDVAVDHLGRLIFVWDGNPAINGGNDIYLRVYPADGSPPEDPALVNTVLENSQDYPRVAVSSDGSFLVIWQSNEPHKEGDGRRRAVRSQAFDSNAQPVGTEQKLNSLSTNGTTEIHADVAALRDGGYVVSWQSGFSFGDDSNTSIQARRIGADGLPLAEQFQVNDIVGNSQFSTAVTELADGGFMILWTIPQLRGRRFSADGTPVGDSFQINTVDSSGVFDPDVVLHDDGRVLVIWRDDEDAENSWEIRGRLYSQNLTALAADFRINTLITGEQQHARAAGFGENGFFVVWQSDVSAGDDNEPWAIEGRIVIGSDQFAGPEMQMNQWVSGVQRNPGIGGKNGRVAVVWQSPSNAESPDSVITGQSWSICGVFCDGFE